MLITPLLLCIVPAASQGPDPWTPTDLLAHPGGLDFEAFGSALAVEADLAAVGVPGQVQDGKFGVGSVHLFERQIGGHWTAVGELAPAHSTLFGAFGSCVDLEGDWLAVGMPGRDAACPGLLNCRSGSVTLFHRQPSGEWLRMPELIPADNEKLDRFGSSVALSGEWLAIGAPGEGNTAVPVAEGNGQGAVYLYQRDPSGAWVEHSKLIPPQADALDFFGAALDLDGGRLIVGSPSFYGQDEQGRVYSFELEMGAWVQTGQWIGSTSAPNDEFGFSVTLEGDRFVAGARVSDSVTVFDRQPIGTWSEVQVLEVPATEFGYSVALDGDRLAVGAPLPVANPTVHVFVEDAGGQYQSEAVLTTGDAPDGEGLGQAVALRGSVLLAGAPLDFGDGTFQVKGAALAWELGFVQPLPNCDGVAQSIDLEVEQTFYTTAGGLRLAAHGDDLVAAGVYLKEVHVLERMGSQFAETGIVDLPGLGGAEAWVSSVAIAPDLLAVGAMYEPTKGSLAGSVFLFERSGGAWNLSQQLFGSDTNAGDHFGVALALEGDTLVVGARNASGVGSSSGAVYVFERSNGIWSERQKLSAAGDDFGEQVAIEGDWLAIGDWKSDSFVSNSGAVHLYDRNSTGAYALAQVLPSPGGSSGDSFGRSLDLHGGRLAAGASGREAMYVYSLDSSSIWTLEQELTAPDPWAQGAFGLSVSLEDDRVVVGAPFSDITASNGGSITVFHNDGSTWAASETIALTSALQGQEFGFSIAWLSDVALVGAPYEGNNVSVHVVPDPGPMPLPSLSIDPPSVATAQPFAWRVCRGTPGQPVALFLTEVEGFATFLQVGVISDYLAPAAFAGAFDEFGTWTVEGLMPALPPISLAFRAYALTNQGAIVSSAPAMLQTL